MSDNPSIPGDYLMTKPFFVLYQIVHKALQDDVVLLIYRRIRKDSRSSKGKCNEK
jgi:hypothetical protein